MAAPANPTVPDDTVVWAIGDVHGRLDLLQPLAERIMADAAATRIHRRLVIFLGDYVDRGPQSREVLQYLIDLPTDIGIEWRFLRGNHEETMAGFLDDPGAGARWCEYGGDATLMSYGLRAPDMKHRVELWAHLSAELNHRITAAERAFLSQLELSISIGDYFFCHAGAKPGCALENQASEDLLWIRRTFLNSDVEFDKIVVHGHTPTSKVYADQRRLGIDTKAYDSGVLTALRLEAGSQRLIQTSVEGATQVTVISSDLHDARLETVSA